MITFLSTKIYCQPNVRLYDISKKQLLNQKIQNYDTLSTKQKWVQLINKFKKSIQAEHQPNPRFLEFLETFKSQRLQTTNNHFNLSLQQCLNYYENFFFLYVNTKEEYQLKPQEKKSLLTSIYETGRVCETGVNGRFYTALQEHQKEEDWVTNVLVKARCNHIHMLQAQYEAKYSLPNSMSVHLYDSLVKLANQKGFGIPVLENIMDIYGGYLDQTRIYEFFNQHFFHHQRQYQREIPHILLQDTLQHLAELISTEGEGIAWPTTGSLDLKGEFLRKLNDFFKSRFKWNDSNAAQIGELIDKLGELSEDASTFTLKSQNEVDIHIRKAIENYLHREQYLLSLDELKKEPQLQKNMVLPSGIDFNSVAELFDGISQKNDAIVQKHSNIMHHFTHHLMMSVMSDRTNFKFIPKFLRNDTRYIDGMILEIEQELLQALKLQQSERIEELFDLLHQVTDGDGRYLKKLDTIIREQDTFKILFYEFDKECINDHLSAYQVSVHELPKLLRTISLDEIIRHHQKNIPFIDRNAKELQKFLNELKSSIPNASQMDELEMKRRACEIEDFQYLNQPYAKKTAITFLAKNKNILEAFVEYQLYQNSLERLLSIIIHDIPLYCVHLLKEGIKAFLCLFIIFKIIPIISYFIDYFLWPLLLAFWVVTLLSLLTRNTIINSIWVVLSRIILLDYELYISIGYRFFHHMCHSLKNLVLLTSSLLNILQIAVCSLIQANIFKTDDFDSACSNIIFRLEAIGDTSSLEKSEILKKLYLKMKEDNSQVPKRFLLDRLYFIEFREKTYLLSFKNVVGMRRTSESKFLLEAGNDFFSFFKPKTSSTNILNAARLG